MPYNIHGYQCNPFNDKVREEREGSGIWADDDMKPDRPHKKQNFHLLDKLFKPISGFAAGRLSVCGLAGIDVRDVDYRYDIKHSSALFIAVRHGVALQAASALPHCSSYLYLLVQLLFTMTKGKDGSKRKVVVQPQAFVEMTLHAVRHKHEAVHGLLLGSCEKNVITITDAVAVSHGAPTRPLVETAIGLAQAKTEATIVGWYTAPPLLNDTKPGPVALRMAANLETDKVDPTLIVIQNAALAASLKGEGKPDDVLQALGKDFGKQWLDPLEISLENPSNALKSVKDAVEKGVQLNDFVDHLDGDVISPWYPRT
jgi:hypothetical protein